MKNLIRKTTMLSLMALTIGFTACGENKKEQEEDASMPMQNEMHMEGHEEMQEMGAMEGNLDNGATGEVEFKNEKMAAVYNHYMHIKTALVNTNAEEAKSGAQMLAEALQNTDGNEQALNAAQKIAQTNDISAQRITFQDLSSAMEKMLSGAIASGEVYKQHCPMAFQGKGGSWISASKEVRNPYYGDKMLKCGSVKETIK